VQPIYWWDPRDHWPDVSVSPMPTEVDPSLRWLALQIHAEKHPTGMCVFRAGQPYCYVVNVRGEWWQHRKEAIERIFNDEILSDSEFYEGYDTVNHRMIQMAECEPCWRKACHQARWCLKLGNGQCRYFRSDVQAQYERLHAEHEANWPRCLWCDDRIEGKEHRWDDDILTGYVRCEYTGVAEFCCPLCHDHYWRHQVKVNERKYREKKWLSQARKQLVEVKRYLREQQSPGAPASPGAASPPGETSPSS
jgi:hypothetical protein